MLIIGPMVSNAADMPQPTARATNCDGTEKRGYTSNCRAMRSDESLVGYGDVHGKRRSPHVWHPTLSSAEPLPCTCTRQVSCPEGRPQLSRCPSRIRLHCTLSQLTGRSILRTRVMVRGRFPTGGFALNLHSSFPSLVPLRPPRPLRRVSVIPWMLR